MELDYHWVEVHREALSSVWLGFPADARVLIVNCDNLGMDDRVTAGVLTAVQDGIATSCSLMAPATAAPAAIEALRRCPDVPFGLHLTLTRDVAQLDWAPLAPAARVPSLVDEDGLLPTTAAAPALLARARIEEVEVELRAQIDSVVKTGLRPTHLDWHVLADGGRPDPLDLTIALATEYELAARVWLDAGRRAARARGLPCIDNAFLDSFSLDVPGKARHDERLLRELPPGLSEWAVHPAADPIRPDTVLGDKTTEDTEDVDLGWAVRHSDLQFLTSDRARRIVGAERIHLVDYRRLQRAWTDQLRRHKPSQ